MTKKKVSATKQGNKKTSLGRKTQRRKNNKKKKDCAYKDKGLERPTFKTFPLCKTMSADPVT